MEKKFTPYVPAETKMREFTFKAIFLGLLMAVVLGAANAYLGLKAGMTVSAAFPAAVIAIAAFRLPFFKGNILEQNMARTTASVGEALAAGAIFILPAFVMINIGGERLWTKFHYWESSILLLVGGLLGILFVTLLRRTLVVDTDLPYPEAQACYEIVRTGQKGESGAKYVFGALGIAVIIEILKNSTGFKIFKDTTEHIIHFPKSIIHHFTPSKEALGSIGHEGGLIFTTPLASPALMGVGYIIGPRIASVLLSGGVLAWLVLIPVIVFLNPDLKMQLGSVGNPLEFSTLSFTVWYNQIRPIAVGSMLVGSFYTLWGLKSSLVKAFKGIFGKHEHHEAAKKNRIDKDLNLKWVFIASLILIIPMIFVFYHFCNNWGAAILAAVVMSITGFLFAAVGGWLVGIVGNSNQPVSGLTLSTLLIAAVLMVAIGVTGIAGVAGALAVASVVCCVACLSGDMIQDLKIGRFIGGTPWKMQVGEIIGTIVVAFVLIFPIIILHEGNLAAGGIGIGDPKLPAPQAGLMAQLASGIISGEMPWGLIVTGMFFSIALILMKAPSPMLIAIGMYLPFETTFAIFVGGFIKWIATKIMERKHYGEDQISAIESKGVLLSSGFIAGEAITGVVMAGLVVAGIPSLSRIITGRDVPGIAGSMGGYLSLIIFAVVAYSLIVIPFKKKK